MKKYRIEGLPQIVHRQNCFTAFKYNGWPTVCKDDKGNLYVAASSMRMGHVDPTGKNCMWISPDEGKTWSPSIILNDSYFDDRDAGIIYLGNGKMLLSWFSIECREAADWLGTVEKCIGDGFVNGCKHLSADDRARALGAFVKLSDNYGMTWGEPIKVPLTAPHGPSVCKDGTLIYMGKEMDPRYLAPNPIVFYSSHDGGKTWEKTGVVDPGEDNDITNENMHEPHVIELPNGRLLGAIRIHGRNNEGSDFTVYSTYSDDKGVTWSKPVCMGVDGSPPHLMVHSSGAVICSYSRRQGWGSKEEREPEGRSERACVSWDNGETWTEDYCLNDEIDKQLDHGYPSTVELSDGSLMTVYYQTYPGDWYTSVLFTKWNLMRNEGEE